MQYADLTSDNIAAAAFVNDSLHLVFRKTGAVYRYPGTSESDFADLVAAPSAGKFFHASIRPHFPHELLEGAAIPDLQALRQL